MHEQERGAYEILGTSWQTVYSEDRDTKMNEAERNSYISRMYEKRIKILKNAIEYQYITEERKKEIEQEIIACKQAYSQIATEELRIIYNQNILKEKEAEKKIAQKRGKLRSANEKNHQLKDEYQKIYEDIEQTEGERKAQKSKFEEFRKQYKNKTKLSAYGILGITQEGIESLETEEEKDEKIKEKADYLLQQWEHQLQKAPDLIEKNENIIKINEIKEAYEEIKTKERRNQYDKYLEDKKQKRIENEYSHTSEYNPELIRAGKGKEGEWFQNRKVKAVKTATRVLAFPDDRHRNLRIRGTEIIGFLDNSSNELKKVYRYEVKRTINGKEKLDVVYTGISMVELTLKKQTEEDFDYYNSLINELFSEENIEASKYNEGYIGNIQKDENGKYYTTLGEDTLSEEEQKMLTAVIINHYKEKQQQNESER